MRPTAEFENAPLSRRRALAVLGLGGAGFLAACAGKTTGGAPATEEQAQSTSPTITLTPDDAATEIVPTAAAGVSVSDGWFQRIALTNANGKVVAGKLNRDRTEFTVTEPLGYGAEYTWSGSVVGQDGQAVPVTGGFSTVNPQTTVNGRFQLADGQTVGVAAPIILQFDAAIADEDKAAVEKSLKVTTTPQVEGSWAWLPDEAGGSRVHWRTKEYYPAGTTVHVDADMYGVKFGPSAYGAADSTLDFTIGRRQVVKAEASSHRIQVITDEGVIMDFPCSYGEGDLDRNVTRSGIHVVTEKYEDFYMTNPAAGYANVHERFAVRISNNGEFIHCNPNSIGAQGNTNVTNGCINLNLENSQQYFNTAMYGDPVEVTGTRIQLSYADGDIWDWAVDWNEWVSMSALSEQAPPSGIPDSAPATPSGAPTLSGTPTTTPALTPGG
ncbi:L,D-transpeptidase [Mycolicibacterium bacteremicum]|uniref:L,D-transpeptidase n=1 Tax=Mycolicibacterium bacteremicum TaxID=564198 RepID=A0A1W9YPG2_MYCBA|nr:Ig-like domain-containing protein [Mycolicibacterium bacteremicum]MCV7432092.1 L,D-transpeptidase family protein [Mycolicibacterium bacteremicum]ORA01887.1 L,D-transpeptidase [Mycolicibacterium bacteremicum]